MLFNISQLNLIDIRRIVENRYYALGKTVTIPDFEKYIAKFQEKHSENIITSFTYPEMASPDPVLAPDSKIPNILGQTDSIFKSGPYSIAALIPLNKTLKIRLIGQNIMNGGMITGWEVINEYPNGMTLNSQRQNGLMSMLIHLDSKGSALIEYYENVTDTPTFTKRISWDY